MSRQSSFLPNSAPHILQPLTGKHGTFLVKWIPILENHGLFFDDRCIATHDNGFSCHNLAQRLLEVWGGKREPEYALQQFDYILACGGTGASRRVLEWLATGCPEETQKGVPA